MSKARQQYSGFTLIELVATMLLMGILASVSASMFVDQTPYKLRLAVDQTVAMLRNARSYAGATNCPVQITQSGQQLNLILQPPATCAVWASQLYSLYCVNCYTLIDVVNTTMGEDMVMTVQVPNGVSLSTSNVPFFFSPFYQAKNSSGQFVNPQIVIGGHTISVVGQTGFINE